MGKHDPSCKPKSVLGLLAALLSAACGAERVSWDPQIQSRSALAGGSVATTILRNDDAVDKYRPYSAAYLGGGTPKLATIRLTSKRYTSQLTLIRFSTGKVERSLAVRDAASLHGIGDFNGDNQGDLAVVEGPGAIILYSGKDLTELHARRFSGPIRRPATAISAAGDLDGDGYDDILVGGGDPFAYVLYGERSRDRVVHQALMKTRGDHNLPEPTFGNDLAYIGVHQGKPMIAVADRGLQKVYIFQIPNKLQQNLEPIWSVVATDNRSSAFGNQVFYLGDNFTDGPKSNVFGVTQPGMSRIALYAANVREPYYLKGGGHFLQGTAQFGGAIAALSTGQTPWLIALSTKHAYKMPLVPGKLSNRVSEFDRLHLPEPIRLFTSSAPYDRQRYFYYAELAAAARVRNGLVDDGNRDGVPDFIGPGGNVFSIFDPVEAYGDASGCKQFAFATDRKAGKFVVRGNKTNHQDLVYLYASRIQDERGGTLLDASVVENPSCPLRLKANGMWFIGMDTNPVPDFHIEVPIPQGEAAEIAVQALIYRPSSGRIELSAVWHASTLR